MYNKKNLIGKLCNYKNFENSDFHVFISLIFASTQVEIYTIDLIFN